MNDMPNHMNCCSVLDCLPQKARLSTEAKFFHALSDPTRLAILRALARGPMKVVELGRLTGRAQPNVSAHLACLRDCGLVRGHHEGRETLYSLAEPEMLEILKHSDRVVERHGAKICSCALLSISTSADTD